MKRTRQIKTFFRPRNFVILFILLFLLIVSSRMFLALVLTLVFIPVHIFSTRLGKFIPHVTPETITASSIFMGYIFGWKIGALFALFTGGYAYMKNSMINLTFMTLVLFASFSAIVAAVLKGYGFGYVETFLLSILFRNITALSIYMFIVFPNPLENIIHHTTHIFFNIFIYMPMFQILYSLVMMFV